MTVSQAKVFIVQPSHTTETFVVTYRAAGNLCCLWRDQGMSESVVVIILWGMIVK